VGPHAFDCSLNFRAVHFIERAAFCQLMRRRQSVDTLWMFRKSGKRIFVRAGLRLRAEEKKFPNKKTARP
jgi:hypothetical protein